MTIIFTDGFDYYTTILQKWSNSGSSIGNVGRTGTGGLTQDGNVTSKQVLVAQEHATFIWGLAVKRGTNGTFEMRFYSDALATQHVTVQVTTTGEIKVFRGNTGGTQLGSTTASGLVPSGSYTYIEAKAVLSDTVGAVTVRINGAQVFTVTGADTKNGGTKTAFDGIGMAITNATADVDDLVLMNGAGSANNDFIGDVKIETLYPTGNGTTSGLTGSDGNSTDNYLLVDERPPNTSDYNGSATDDLLDTYAMGDLTTLSGTVYGAVAYAYAAKSDAGTKGGAIMVRSGGTDYEKTDNALGTSYVYYNEIMEQNPNTSTAWTIATINSVELGYKVKAS